MNRKMKWTLALFPILFLFAVLAISIVVFFGDYEYEILDNAAIITKYKGLEDVVTIPAMLGGAPVKEIGSNAFSMNRSISIVKIPDGVTKIANGAFAQTYMTQVYIPDSVTEIGNQAFKNSWLSNFDLPENLERIGEEAFWKSLEQLEDQAFWNSANKKAIIIPAKVSYIGEAFLCGSRKVKSIEVSTQNAAFVSLDGVLYSGDKKTLLAYPAGRSADRYDIPAGVKRIAAGAFRNSTIAAVTISEEVESIGNDAFGGCMKLLKIDLPASVTSIEDDFHFATSCDALESIHVSRENSIYASVDGVLFDKAMTTLLAYPPARKADSFIVPGGVKTINYRALSGSEGLRSIRLPDGLESIRESAFSSSSLEGITLPDGVTSIGDRAFQNCESLSSVTLSGSLTSIGQYAFYGCTGLESITIPGQVASIGYNAFDHCSNLASIVIPSSVTSIGEEAFKDCSKLTISGEAGSFAEAYAEQNNIPFMAVKRNLPAGT